jgi:hypothetical protein
MSTSVLRYMVTRITVRSFKRVVFDEVKCFLLSNLVLRI